jgi:hypothetical protein
MSPEMTPEMLVGISECRTKFMSPATAPEMLVDAP